MRHAALGLLADQPASGYDLLKLFQLSMDMVWPATQSQLYGELNKMAAEGLIKVANLGPRGRKEYAITDAGGPSCSAGCCLRTRTRRFAMRPCCAC